ncbi:ABC transporter permease [Microbacterium soli]|uniref:ABC transporter permease n=1 Tax=Microbacterium soli TaxID=446075 RepID=A0ABP7NKF3_9MICO
MRTERRLSAGIMLLPAAVIFAVAFVLPLAGVAWRSITEPEPGLGNYVTLLFDGVSLTVILRTGWVALLVTLVTLVLGYPYAYALTLVSPRTRAIMFTLVLVPFWTSMMARNFAWLVLLQNGGPLQRLFAAVGREDVVLFGTTAGVVIAMSQVLLPFMVLPLFSVMQGIDRRLVSAAVSLGSSHTRAFWKVYWPLSRRGIVSGFLLVFSVSLGFYVTPAIIGSPQESLIAQLLSVRTMEQLDFGGAGALGLFVLVVTLLLVAGISRFGGSTSALGSALSRKDGISA